MNIILEHSLNYPFGRRRYEQVQTGSDLFNICIWISDNSKML